MFSKCENKHDVQRRQKTPPSPTPSYRAWWLGKTPTNDTGREQGCREDQHEPICRTQYKQAQTQTLSSHITPPVLPL